ncbi:type IX secretion system outer membrane channel protein PorV [bacterium SCSIO 12643]|nr:type IX secretion system outer membrane channel protein PorV [bacterium SCSIO 12643]
MNSKKIVFILSAVLISCYSVETFGQDQRQNPITTAVPFLTINPDARHGALGSAGAATSPDVYDNYHNPAKLSFIEEDAVLGLSYTPWLSTLVPGISLSYLTGVKKIDKMSAIGGSLRYFTLGEIQFTDEFGNPTISHQPNEFALDGAYSRKLSERFSMSISLRFIYSNLTGGQSVGGADTKAGLAVASDIFSYYQNDDISVGDKDATLTFGMGISNIGNKMAYSDINQQDFLPQNFKFGSGLTIHLDDYNDFAIVFDMNKLLVPTPPIYGKVGSTNQIVAGKDPNRSPANAIFSSWSDAPGEPLKDNSGNYILNADGMAEIESGSVLNEELRELYFGFGMEYWYNKVFAARMGYFAEHDTKGNRKYLSFGVGLKYNVFAMDIAYLVPFYIGSQVSYGQSPLANTLQFTMSFAFNKNKSSGNSDSSSSTDSF